MRNKQYEAAMIKQSEERRMSKIALCNDRTFYTIQGEAPYIGHPAVFLRVTACNLKCSWCDTPYTTFPDQLEKIVEPTDKVALELFAHFAEHPDCKLLVITGGEPLLQLKAIKDVLKKLAGYLEEITPADEMRAVKVQFETNGTQPPLALEEEGDQDSESVVFSYHYVVSPKGHVAGNEDLKADIHPAFFTKDIEWDVTMKIVYDMSNEVKTQALINDVMQRASKILVNNIYLMPEGWLYNKEAYKYTAEVCMEWNLKFCPRVHTLCWGDDRGV
jgi:7-carboxy-7-deazaguanine synthase